MEKITYFYLNGCPYCRNADRAFEELMREVPHYADVEIERINEMEREQMRETNSPEGLSGYDFYYVPTLYVGHHKVYEAHPSHGYEEIRENVRQALEAAIDG